MNNIKRLGIICGGTGGHFYPGLTIAKAFQENETGKACLFVGGHVVGDQVSSAKKHGIDVKEVKSARISKHPIKLFIFGIRLVQGFLHGRRLLKEFKPDAVLAMGSFTSVPMSLAAVSRGIPLFLHDGNARVGRANIFLSKWAKLAMTAFPAVNQKSLKCGCTCVGMPLREEIIAGKLEKYDALEKLNKEYDCLFKHKGSTILIFGGSQGAGTINKVIPKTISTLESKNIQVIHLTGKGRSKETALSYKNGGVNCLALESCNEMGLLYSAADFVICRSGGSTVSELAFFNKPAILIPYPFASDQHQNDNAEFYTKSGLGEVVLNDKCTEARMKPLINKFIANSQREIENSFLSSEEKVDATEEILKQISKYIYS